MLLSFLLAGLLLGSYNLSYDFIVFTGEGLLRVGVMLRSAGRFNPEGGLSALCELSALASVSALLIY